MTDIGYFAARILFNAQLDEPNFFMFELNLAFNADDGSALKSGGDAAVEVLFPGDVHLPNNIET